LLKQDRKPEMAAGIMKAIVNILHFMRLIIKCSVSVGYYSTGCSLAAGIAEGKLLKNSGICNRLL